jgi:hypothetical protein
VAIYVPRARRRRNLILVTVVAAVFGAGVGLAVGRSSAPTVDDRVRSVRNEARAIGSQLRVVSIHAEDRASSVAAGGDAGADLALRRTEANLARLSRRAPWVPRKTASDLLSDTVALRASAPGHASSDAFGKQVDSLADRIESAFGAAG